MEWKGHMIQVSVPLRSQTPDHNTAFHRALAAEMRAARLDIVVDMICGPYPYRAWPEKPHTPWWRRTPRQRGQWLKLNRRYG